MSLGILGTRALNEYRRRSIFTYIGLRHYLENVSARTDRWAREVATPVLRCRGEAGYFHSKEFKALNEQTEIETRDLFIPAPNEALAEAAILSACSETGGPFADAPEVFSYRLSLSNEKSGMYRRYFSGFSERRARIYEACCASPTHSVLHLDIRHFYPSIRATDAKRVWERTCNVAKLGSEWRQAGERLLADYVAVQPGLHRGLITGPMFSHLIANLVLRDFDEQMHTTFTGRYFRYVDDLCLVLPDKRVNAAEREISDYLGNLGLALNPRKRLVTSAADWSAAHKPHPPADSTKTWYYFVACLKHFLVIKPHKTGELERLFHDNELRIPVIDYSAASRDRSFIERTKSLLSFRALRARLRTGTSVDILRRALELRTIQERAFFRTAERLAVLQEPARKNAISRIRWLGSHLIYLSSLESLAKAEAELESTRELAALRCVMHAIRTQDVTELLPFGGKVAQAAAQALAAMNLGVTCRLTNWFPQALEAWAVLQMYGVPMERAATLPAASLWPAAYAVGLRDFEAVVSPTAAYAQELILLPAGGFQKDHRRLLHQPLTVSEPLVFDALNLDPYSY